MTLENVTKELVTANSKLDDIHRDNSDILEYLELSQSTFKEGFLELLDFFKGSSLKELEDKREDDVYRQQVLDALQNLEPKETKDEEKKAAVSLGGIGLILAGLLGVTIGVISGWLKAIKGFYKLLTPSAIQKAVADTLKGIQNIFKSLVLVVKTQVSAISLAMAKQFKALGDSISRILNSGSRLGRAVTAVGSRLSALVKIFTDAGKTIRSILSGPIGKIGETFKLIQGYLSSFGRIVGTVARFVSRLFAPLIVIMTIFDTVKGFLEGFEEEGIIGGIKGAITGFFNSLIFGPLDMIKDATAWVLGAFGFDKAEEILKSFSFAQLFTDLVDGVFTLVSDIFGWVKKQFGFTGEGMPSFTDLVLGFITLPYNLIKTVVGKIAGFFGFDKVEGELEGFDFKDLIKRIISSLTDMVLSAGDYVIGKFKSAGAAVADIVPDMDSIKNFLKGVLRNVLPVNDPNASWFSIKNLVASAIPDSVYEFAGIDPKTGEIQQQEQQQELPAGVSTGVPGGVPVAAVPTDLVTSKEFAEMPRAEKDTYESKQNVNFEKRRMSRMKSEMIYDEMNMAQSENAALQSQAAGGRGSATVNSNSTVNNMNSSNTTVVRPQVMPTRQPNSPSDMIWDGGANVAP